MNNGNVGRYSFIVPAPFVSADFRNYCRETEGESMKKSQKKWDNLIESLRKARGAAKPEDDESEEEVIIEEEDDDEADDDFEEDDEDDEVGEGDIEYEDASPELKKVNDSLEELKTMFSGIIDRLDGLDKSQASLQKALRIPRPKKSVTSAAELGGGLRKASGALRHKPFTRDLANAAMNLILESAIPTELVSEIEYEMNKSIANPAYQISRKNIELLLSVLDKRGGQK